MRVLIINSVCGVGSTGRIVAATCNTVLKSGGDCVVAYGIGTPQNINPVNTYKINNKIGYYAHNFAAKLTDRTGFYSKHQTKKLIDFIKHYNPDVIHLHNLHGYYINIEILFKFLRVFSKAIVWTLHDCWPFTGHCSHFSYARCDKWISGCYRCSLKKRYPKSFLLDNSKKNYLIKKELFTDIDNLNIIVPSKWLRDVCKRSFLKNYDIKVIPNGIDLSLFKPVVSDFKDKNGINGKMILAVSYVWNNEKGLNDIFQLADIIDGNYTIVLVGLNNKRLKKRNNVIFIPRTESIESLAEIYSAADVFINTSYEETMGMVTIEAMACGTPVVVYNKTAVPEVVDNKTGIIVEAGNIVSLKEAIKLAEKLDPNDCINSAKKYDKDIQYLQYLDSYKEAMLKIAKKDRGGNNA